MELSDKKLNAFQKGLWQKYFSLAGYGVCIVAVTYAIDRLIQRDINNALASLQKKADISEQSLQMLASANPLSSRAAVSIRRVCSERSADF